MAKHKIENHLTRQQMHSAELQRAKLRREFKKQQKKYTIIGWGIAIILGPVNFGIAYGLHLLGVN